MELIMTNPNNESTPVSEWLKRAASVASFIEDTIPSKKTPIEEKPTKEEPQSIYHTLIGIVLIFVSIILIIFCLRIILHNVREQVTHTTIVPEQYHFTNTPPINTTNFTQIQQCIQEQQACYIPTDVFQRTSSISLSGYIHHQHATNNNGLWISNGHNGHPESVYILFPNDPVTYVINQKFFPGNDIAIYAHDNDIPLYHVDGNGGQNKQTDEQETTHLIGSIIFHAIL